ncbi:hypothetical protein DSECCO2_611090 [anaerobic digester metagenome]
MPETTFHTTFSNSQFLHLTAKNGSQSGFQSAVSYRFGFNGKENDYGVKVKVLLGVISFFLLINTFCQTTSNKDSVYAAYLFKGHL